MGNLDDWPHMVSPHLTLFAMIVVATGRQDLAAAAAVRGGTGARARPISVSTVGDSITCGAYPEQLGALLGPGYNVTNRAVSGHTMLVTPSSLSLS